MSSSDADLGRILADIVEEASGVIMPFWSHGGTVAHTSKADSSPVTEADQAGEKLIVARLAEHFPDVHVVAEEHASEFGTPEAVGSRFFLVDPVDGTKAFMKGDPNFTVNIGLVVDGRPVAGAVCAPASGETWFTTAAGTMKRKVGATEAHPVHVRPWPKGEAVCLISHTMKPETADALQREYGFDKKLALDSSIKLCRIAEGAADIYPRHGPTANGISPPPRPCSKAPAAPSEATRTRPSSTARPTSASSTSGSWRAGARPLPFSFRSSSRKRGPRFDAGALIRRMSGSSNSGGTTVYARAPQLPDHECTGRRPGSSLPRG